MIKMSNQKKEEIKYIIVMFLFTMFIFFISVPLIISFFAAIKFENFELAVFYGGIQLIAIVVLILVFRLWLKSLNKKLRQLKQKEKTTAVFRSIEEQQSLFWGISGVIAILGGIFHAYRSITNGEWGKFLISFFIILVGSIYFILRRNFVKSTISLYKKRLKGKWPPRFKRGL